MDSVLFYVGSILLSLFLLFYGSELLVRHAVKLSTMFGVSSFLTGLTVVAMGTSMPEVFTTGSAAFKGESVLILTGLIGSNIFNIAAILGFSCLIQPYVFRADKDRTYSFNAVDLFAFSLASLLPFAYLMLTSRGKVSLIEALSLLSVFFLFLFIKIFAKKKQLVSQRKQLVMPSFLYSSFMILCAIILLGGGGELLIRTVSRIADKNTGLTRHVLGVLIVACGTSLPELFASLVAIIKKEHAISLGNLLGSTIFNTLFILPLARFFSELSAHSLLFDLSIMLGITLYVVIRLLFSASIKRGDAVLLTGTFLSYVAYLILR